MTKLKKNMKQKYYYDKKLYKKRIRVENFFQLLKNFRRIQLRYDHKHSVYYSFVYLALSQLIFKKI